MSAEHKDIMDEIDVPPDVFTQLLSNISAAGQEQGRGGRSNHPAMEEPVRATQNTAMLAGGKSMGGLLNSVVQDDSDSSSDEANSDAQADKDGSWPLAKWQHQVKMPHGATSMSLNQSSLNKAALASEKAFSAKLVRIVLFRWQSSQKHVSSSNLNVQTAFVSALTATGMQTPTCLHRRSHLQARAPLQDSRKAEKASRKVQEDTAGKDWFDMKAQPVTDSVKRDWRLLRLRATYDPKRFYKVRPLTEHHPLG